MPKIIAIRSTTNDISTTRLPARYRKPSSTAAKPHRAEPRSVLVAGMGVNRIVAQIGARQHTASMRYSVDRSTHRNITPASRGPTIAPNWKTVMLSAFAAGN